jgi:hypothetical protein
MLGTADGTTVEVDDGSALGSMDGNSLSSMEGLQLGCDDGIAVRWELREANGYFAITMEGSLLGCIDGPLLGSIDGCVLVLAEVSIVGFKLRIVGSLVGTEVTIFAGLNEGMAVGLIEVVYWK